MFEAFGIINMLAFWVLAVAAGFWAYLQWQKGQPQRQHVATKRRLSEAGTVDTEEQTPQEMAQANLKFLGVPAVGAGRQVFNVPCIDPNREGNWQKDREVLTTSHIGAYNQHGEEMPMQFMELGDGYAVLTKGNKVFLLQNVPLSTPQEEQLETERREVVQTADTGIRNFLGVDWTIKGAMGDNKNTSAGGRKCSYVQVLTTHPELGQSGRVSNLPPNLFDRKVHDYYDLQALSADGQALFAFYAGGSWNCYVGRILTEEERHNMQGI